MPTPQERKQLEALLRRSPKWHQLANKRVRNYCIKLGYDCNRVQSSEEWLTNFEATLLTVGFWSERKTILQLEKFGSRRAGMILLLLYLFAQHGRIQFKPPVVASIAQDDGSPFEELRSNHHNLDHSLLRLICGLCGYRDKRQSPAKGLLRALGQKLTRRYLGPGIDDIAPNRVARWAQVAEIASGVAPRDVDRLQKTWKRTKGSAADALQKRAFLYFRQAWAAKTPKDTSMLLLLCGSVAYGFYSIWGWLHRLLHF